MKKNYFFTLLLMLFTLVTFSQTPVITMISDGDCSGGNPKVVEIFAQGTVNFSEYTLENQTNANTTWANPLDLSALGTITDDYVYIYKESTAGIFSAEYPSASNTLEDTGSTTNFNGDDRIRIVKNSDSSVIDQFGVDGEDGTGKEWEYIDGYAKRNPGTSPNGTFTAADWTFAKSALDGQGSCQGGSTFESIIGLGTYNSSTPSLSITSPANNTEFIPGTTEVTVAISVQNFNVANGTGDGHIHYSLDGAADVMKFDTNDISLTGLTAGNHQLKVWLVDNSHTPLNPAVEATVDFSIASFTQVATLAELRAGTQGNYYEVTGEVVVTYNNLANRNQRYIQDGTAAILIDDSAGTITTTLNVGDGITGLKGRLGAFSGTMQFVPAEDTGAATSTGNTVAVQSVTLADLVANIDSYESEWVKIESASFDDADGTVIFEASKNYNITEGTDTMVFRTNFAGVDYLGTVIPSGSHNITGIAGRFNTTVQIYATELAGIVLGLDKNQIEGFAIYPNPVKGNAFTLQTASLEEKQVSIFNVLGKKVVSQKVVGNNKQINIGSLATGIYILKVDEAGKTATKKLVIK